ncbi:MAG: type II toxin-antitoxin system VapC family toxin [Phormidesmis sp. CAN_BIN44]|nr:type II toxin-antitoxin system VapC family toxin [Phormidesmis sp. CAN_BIN44]
MRQIVLDAGALIALFYAGDRHHTEAVTGFRQLLGQKTILWAPLPIVFEVYKWLLNNTRYETACDAFAAMLDILQSVFLNNADVIALQLLIRSLPGWRGSLEDASVILIAQRDRCPVWTMNYRDFGTIQGLEFWTPD